MPRPVYSQLKEMLKAAGGWCHVLPLHPTDYNDNMHLISSIMRKSTDFCMVVWENLVCGVHEYCKVLIT